MIKPPPLPEHLGKDENLLVGQEDYRAIQLAAMQHMREECAKVCAVYGNGAWVIADAIRKLKIEGET